MADDISSLDLTARLFGNTPPTPVGNRPGLDERKDYRQILTDNETSLPQGKAPSLLSQEEHARVGLLLRELTALLQNSNITTSLPAYGAPHLWSTPVDLSGTLALPAAAGPYQTVLTLRVPPGRWARIAGYGVDVDGNFTYDGSILWRIRKNGINVPDLADWGQHRGSVVQPRETFILGDGNIGDNQGAGDVFTFEVRRAVAAVAISNVSMVLTGWTWRPRNNYEGTRSGMTAF